MIAVEAALVDKGIEAYDAYSSAFYPAIRLAAIGLMEILLTTPNTTNNVTGFSVTYDRGAVQSRLALLRKEAGINQPSINVVNKW